MGKDTFLKGALILTVAGFMVKVIGSVNRIILPACWAGRALAYTRWPIPFIY